MSDIDNKFFLLNEQDQYFINLIASKESKATLSRMAKAFNKWSTQEKIEISFSKAEAQNLELILSWLRDGDRLKEMVKDQMEFDDLIWKLRDDKKKAEEKLRKIFNFFRFDRKAYDLFSLQTTYHFILTNLYEGKCTLEDIINMYLGDPLYLGPDDDKRIRRKDIPKHKIAEAEELINEFYGKTVESPSIRLRGESRKKKRNINQVAYALVAINYGLTEDALRKHFPPPKSSSKKR